MSKTKYIGAYIVPVLGLITFNSSGIFAYSGLFFLYVLVPLFEQIITSNGYNLNQFEKELSRKDSFFDWILYISVPIHLFVVYQFLITISNPILPLSNMIADILMMGTILGVNGINIGHELGHKTDHLIKSVLAHIMLLTAIQNHFIPYHNGGHHRDVATPDDLSSAKEGDVFYFFAIRSQIGGYFKTWELEKRRLKVQGKNTIYNPMIIFTLLPFILFYFYFIWFKSNVTLFYYMCLWHFSFRISKLFFTLWFKKKIK